MFKRLNDMAPRYLSTKFSTRSSIHDREMRNRNDLDIAIFKTSYGRRTFKFRATKLWNDLDNNFKNISSYNISKKQLKLCMVSNILS